MNEQAAKRLVEATFNQPYDEARFRTFVRNVFREFGEKDDRALSGNYIWDDYKDHVAQYKRIGSLTDAEENQIDILAVKLKGNSKLERARTTQRNFVAKYLDRGRGDIQRDAALVAFYSDDTPDWRFSLVRMEYSLDFETGKTSKELSPARRYSFLVGEGERTHTAQQQLLPILRSDAPVTLDALEAAFDIESVTAEFFKQYKALFLELKEELDALLKRDQEIQTEFETKDLTPANFAKRLMGQVVFLYFLQKKGWLGVQRGEAWGAGPKDFLRRLYKQDYVPYTNFFDDILEPLFYEALALERSENFYSRFDCKIPFLNGGLFEPSSGYDWVNVPIPLKNTTFERIMDVFDLYNFTVREDEPLEKEVAVDPEMLGKVFENLLEVEDRKSKGAFYTPREIVHYMCQESLVSFLDTHLNTVRRPMQQTPATQDHLFTGPQATQAALTEEVYEPRIPREDLETFIRLGDQAVENDTRVMKKGKETDKYAFRLPESVREHAQAVDDALANIKVCDPAIGSGAFPVGIMNEIVRARAALTPHLKDPQERTPYALKRRAIQESIYGVDIDRSAVDIAKLRLWLSLVVDEDDADGIEPLPNLDYKIVAGNSLVSVERHMYNDDLFKRLETLKDIYLTETRPSEKDRLRKEITSLIGKLTNHTDVFDFHIYFSEIFTAKGGFDITIGNPPYIRIQELKRSDPEQAKYFKEKYASAGKGNYDIYVVFVEKGLDLLNEHGYLSYILPHKFFNAKYGEPLRELIAEGKNLSKVVHFGDEQIFEGASTYVCLLFLSRIKGEYFEFQKVNDINLWKRSKSALAGKLSNEKVKKAEWNFVVGREADLFNRLDESFSKLDDVSEKIFQGLVTSADAVYLLESLASENEGHVEVKSKATGEEYLLETEVTKRLCKGALDVRRYTANPSKRVIFPYDAEKSTSGSKAVLIPEAQFYKQYPKTWSYLKENSETLRGREKGKMDHEGWYGYVYPKSVSLFARKKILTPSIAAKGSYTLDKNGELYFVGSGGGGGGGYGIILKSNFGLSYEYVLGLLNSRLLDFFLFKISSQFRGGYYAYSRQYIEQLPIRTLNLSNPTDKHQHNCMTKMVDEMLGLHEQKAGAAGAELERVTREIAALDARIDSLVYELYGLTEEEVKIVEGSVS